MLFLFVLHLKIIMGDIKHMILQKFVLILLAVLELVLSFIKNTSD